MLNKARVVIAYLDGRRLKGYVNDFSAVRDHLFLFPEGTDSKTGERGISVRLNELKALFFVKDFAGDPSRPAAPEVAQAPGKKVEVTFPDGEQLVGFTVAYNPKNLGFFVQPANPASNNERIFVVNGNVKRVRML
jgi:hypothetical protein